ncbi:MAG: hypothetical protein LBC75_02375 [Fibromonadaceae bacterium]|jgi:hypothetical protein|nr:hypothetical protein [Fibromonadaceae bacterium]
MKVKPLFFCTLAFAAPVLANFTPADSAKALAHCRGSSFMGIEVFGKDPGKARSNAKIEITNNIISQVRSEIKTSNSSEEKNGIFKESSRYLEKSKIESNLTLAGFQEIEPPKRLENGEFVLKGYVCTKDAAKPYLNSLKDLARTLKTQTQKTDGNSCKIINETYKSIEGLEIILDYFARMSNDVQTEYEALKEEYQSDGGSGVFLEIKENIFGEKSDVIGSKLREVLSTNNCRIERNVCKANGGFTLRINATACNHKNDGTFDHCSSCLKIDLLNGRNEIVLSPSVATKAAWDGKSAACEKAFELSAPEIFNKVKEKISEVCK